MKKRKKERNPYNYQDNFFKTVNKVFTYKIPEKQLNEIIRFQVQKFGSKINSKFINTSYDQDGNVFKKRRRK